MLRLSCQTNGVAESAGSTVFQAIARTLTQRSTPEKKYRIVMAPLNVADQPMTLVRALRKRGHYARQVNYSATGEHPFGYELDIAVRIQGLNARRQFEVLRDCLEQQFDIYHFWQRSFLFDRALQNQTGLDLPLIKSRGHTIFHRFTGMDLRESALDRRLNPHSPFNHGYLHPYDEKRQKYYRDFCREYVDLFFVQDPEMAQFMPEAQLLPRALELDAWQFVGVQSTRSPLIVHAPSNSAVKGTKFILKAIDSMRHAGLNFEFKLLDRLSHREVREWLTRADIVVDQIMIGAAGVLTLEAWALGKPCVSFLREDLFNPFYETSALPVANATPENVEQVLTGLLGDEAWRRELSRGGRMLVEKFHDSDVVCEKYLRICADYCGDRTPSPKSLADVEFLLSGTPVAIAGDERNAQIAQKYPRLAALSIRFFALQIKAGSALLKVQKSVLSGAFRALSFLRRLISRR